MEAINHPQCHYGKKHQTRGPLLSDILADVCVVFEQSMENVTGRLRKQDYVKCRRIFTYVSHIITDSSLESISKMLNRDHTTAIHHIEKVQEFIDSKDSLFERDWSQYVSKSIFWNTFNHLQNTINNEQK